MKVKIFLGLISFISASPYAATVPAEAFSRANCEAYIPSFGYGWYNESISYDALTGVHKNLYAKTDQKATNGNQRTDNSSNPSGYRVRAGFVDPKSDKRFWNVSGTHYETLDNGRAVSQYTSAKDCNFKFGQFL
ncbi:MULTISPECIES: hypothetical protein [Acinetobacter]|uniref:Uncharacterized protein n=2 Tax=Gammaproteobacteria TaxID=1236 RepID=A0A7S8WHL0_ACIBA|nr:MULTISPECIES: hypothetical protein [Acinetobacter]AZN69783.1 hypothetical protein DX910_17010 [Acinetobacter haemolyticus]APJ20455.1 hypothetical protein BS064_15605 [Acinetobacter baumannii]ENW85957.1 hypothetical protein F905_02992 [Acinetobacter sp. CIP 53.82]MBF6763857.1 hypothetical protein [Acinetobacter baumannii]MBF6779144.1 hypothetical protein [Acinetobacter baumannii]